MEAQRFGNLTPVRSSYDSSFFSSIFDRTLEVFDDVATQFAGLSPTNYNTWATANTALLSPPATLIRNSSWNGAATSNLLEAGQSLAGGASGMVYVSFDVTVNPVAASSNNTLRDNSATSRGTSPTGVVVSDTSTNGLDPDGVDGDNNPDETSVTPAPFVKLVKEVRNCGGSLASCTGTFAVSATGKPGEYLEYRVRYYNISSQSISALLVTDTLQAATPFQENSYGALLDKEFLVQCPNLAVLELDVTSTATNTSTLTGSPQVVRVDVMNAAACNLTQVAPGESGYAVFGVRIP